MGKGMAPARHAMRRLARFRRLGRRDQLLLLQALLLLAVIRVGLKSLSLPRIMQLTQRPLPLRFESMSPSQIGWAVAMASRYVPGAACLTQALAAQVLLNGVGISTALRIGVAKEGDDLAAHAWLESDGTVIFGDSHPEYFTPLPHLLVRRGVTDQK